MTAEVAFRYLADPRNRPEWQSSLLSVDVPPDEEPHLGQAWSETTAVGVRPHIETTVLDAVPRLGRAGHWRGVDRHPGPALHRRPAAAGCGRR